MKRMITSVWASVKGHAMARGGGGRALAAVGLAALAGCFAGGCASDGNVRSLAASTNGKLQARMDRMVRDGEVQTYVNGVAAMVLEGAKQHRTIDPKKDGWVYDKFNAMVVLDKSVNAFVTGDDTVFVHSGLLRELTHPDQLAAVLTHELAHIEERHLKDNINRDRANMGLALIAVAGSVMGGNIGRGVSAGAAGGAFVNSALGTQFNSKQELAADARGLDLFMAMGFEPSRFTEVFEILKKKYGDGAGGSHPTNSARIAHLQKLKGARASGAGTAASRTLDLGEFQRIQELVKREEVWAPKESLLADPALRNSLASCFSYVGCKDCDK